MNFAGESLPISLPFSNTFTSAKTMRLLLSTSMREPTYWMVKRSTW